MKQIVKITLALSLIIFMSAATINVEPYQIGDQIEDFSLMSIDGNLKTLADYKDVKGYVITFTCNHCPYAVMYEDRLIEIHERFGDEYPIIAINPNDPEVQPGDSFEAMKERSAEKSFPFDYLFDANQEIFPLFGATKTPEVFLVDSEMVLRYKGAIDDNAQEPKLIDEAYLISAIVALNKGEEPEIKSTKAIGCSIKVKK